MITAIKFSVIFALIIIAIFARSAISSFGQTTASLEPGFGQALAAVNSAEASGATQREIAPLVTLLNKALSFNVEAYGSPGSSENRTQLLLETDHLLTQVEDQANGLANSAYHRTQLNDTMIYGAGIIAAALITILFMFILSLYRKRSLQRTLQMRVKLR